MLFWDLIFHTEDEESTLRVRHIESTLNHDPHVRYVEEYGIARPHTRHLRVWFSEGCKAPKNRAMQHLHQIYSEPIAIAQGPTGLDLILSDDFDP